MRAIWVARIDALFAEDGPLPEILEEGARLGAQLLMQAALEAEVSEFLGRDRYQRAATTPQAQPGSRIRHRPATVKTTAGGRLVLPDAPRLPGGAGAGGVGDHHRRETGFRGPGRNAPRQIGAFD